MKRYRIKEGSGPFWTYPTLEDACANHLYKFYPKSIRDVEYTDDERICETILKWGTSGSAERHRLFYLPLNEQKHQIVMFRTEDVIEVEA